MNMEFFAVFAGTVAFSLLYGVPHSCYLWCGLTGCAGWAVYLAFDGVWGQTVASFAATMAVALIARSLAVRKRAPTLIFLLPGIFPLVPGAGIYWTVYYLVMDKMGEALSTGYSAVKCAAAIVLGLVFVFELPQKLFRMRLR